MGLFDWLMQSRGVPQNSLGGMPSGNLPPEALNSSAVPGRSYHPAFQGGRSDAAGYTTSSPGWRHDDPQQMFPPAPPMTTGALGAPTPSPRPDPQTTGAVPTPSPRPADILEDRETRFRPSIEMPPLGPPGLAGVPPDLQPGLGLRNPLLQGGRQEGQQAPAGRPLRP
jgi:hypothetical protein